MLIGATIRGSAKSGAMLIAVVVGAMLPGAAAAQGTASDETVTFTKHVLPIMQRSCQYCHRPESVAPMSLLTYEEVRPWARAVKQRTTLREMPPWFVERNVGVQGFKEDPSLTDEEIAIIAKWVDSGAPRGNPADAPPPVNFEDRDVWRIGTPEWIVYMPQEETILPVDPDKWLDFRADSRLTEDRYIKAVETKPAPGAYRVVHHATTRLVWENEDGSEGGGSLNEYAMGKNGDIYPEETGRLIKAGAKIGFNLHYSSIGREVKDRTRVGLQFHPKGFQPKYEIVVEHVGDSFDTLDIRPGDSYVRTDGYKVLTKPAVLTGFQPHMHIRGRRMCLEAIRPSGQIETLSCTKVDFGWHIVYNYREGVQPLLEAGTILHVIGWHDNSSANRWNPDPKNWAGFGNRSIDDMAFSWTSYFYVSEEEFKQRVEVRKAQRAQQLSGSND